MPDITTQLIRRLEELSTERHLPLERRLIDTALWFHKNKDRIPRDNLAKRLDFLEKALDIHIEMVAMLVDRMQMSEGRPAGRSLWLPNGMELTGDLTKFG